MGHAQSSLNAIARHNALVAARDQRTRADLGVDNAGFCVPHNEPPKQDPPAEKRWCKVCKIPKELHDFPSKRKFKTSGHCTACTCSYCGLGGKMTKEHLLPRSVGGTAIIAACCTCNNERGRSGRYPPFLRYIKKHPHTWATAVLSSTRDPTEVSKYLSDEDLHNITFLALQSRINTSAATCFSN
jgi:hypothetical protein